MTASALVVTGATGRIGGLVASSLQSAGIDQRLLVRDPGRLPERLRELPTSIATYGDGEAVHEALRGARIVLMVSAAESADRLEHHLTFVDAATAAGVEHIVYTSFAGASPAATFLLARDHAATEQRIEASGMRHTFLRDNLYLDYLPLLAGADGVVRGPAGRGRVAAVAQCDVSAVAAAVLSDLGPHVNATYDLTGPQALTLDEAAATVREVTGRDVTYHHESIEEAYASRAGLGAQQWELDAWVSTYTAIAAGELAPVSDHVERILGRPPLSLAEVLRHA
ncbi:MAG: SDR family oxidoreductase [Actinomycetota bacterium]|nr:SDR family oxidoreductase [Actinomycetota bacterium]